MKNTIILFCCFLACHLNLWAQNQDEEAIKAVLVAETQGFLDASPALAQHWNVKPSSTLMVSSTRTGDIWHWGVEGEELQQWLLSDRQKREGCRLTVANHNIQLAGNIAWVIYDEQFDFADGTVKKARTLKILEKVDGNWKVVACSSHYDD